VRSLARSVLDVSVAMPVSPVAPQKRAPKL